MRPLVVSAALVLLLPLAGCGSGDDDKTLTVLAAASLTDVFQELAVDFEKEHGVEVDLSFGSSTALAEQAADGAPGDVLATADRSAMSPAEEAGVAGDIAPFATNVLVIVTPPGNPAGVESLADLNRATWVRCADEAPCGRVALDLLADNDVTAEPASLEEDARATLDKVASGEADAGLVYATDAFAADDRVEAVGIPGADTRKTTYFITALEQSEDDALAQQWVDMVSSREGRQVLFDVGFGPP